MTDKLRQHGFTLIELLVAVALISIILSMAYGSYVTTTKSAESCKSRIALSEQGRRVLEQIARHIRCSYAGAVSDNDGNTRSGSDQQGVEIEQTINYFNGNARSAKGEILNLVTTCGLLEDKAAQEGLFEVSYRFNRRTRQLAASVMRFVGKTQKLQQKNLQVISDDVESVDLEFYDGEDWLRRWDFTEKKELPRAVRIEITGLNENRQRYDYSTVAYINVSRAFPRLRSGQARPRSAGKARPELVEGMPATRGRNADRDFSFGG